MKKLLLVVFLLAGCDAWNTVETDLNAPQLSAPIDESAFLIASTVKFSWFAIDDAVDYKLEIRRWDNETTEVIEHQTSDTSLTMVLEASGFYSWRVCALTSVEERGRWSEIWSFSLQHDDGD